MALVRLPSRTVVHAAAATALTFLRAHSHGHHLLFSTSTHPHFMLQYLVSTCGLSPAAAAKAAPRLAHLPSPSKPDAALAFLRSQGLRRAHIRSLVAANPALLCSDVAATLAPKFHAVRALGFARADAAALFACYPTALTFGIRTNLLPRLLFWLDLFGSSTRLLMKWLRRTWLLKYSVSLLLQNMASLRSYGVPDGQLTTVLRLQPMLIMQTTGKLAALAGRVEACGLPRTSGMFMWGLLVLRNVGDQAFRAKKAAVMRLAGCTEAEFAAMFRRAPCFLSMSEAVMRRKVEFLKRDAGCSTEYLVRNPVLMTLSLDKRMEPRRRAIEMLQANGVDVGRRHLGSVMRLSEASFMEKYILKHKDEVPQLLELYASGCKG